MLAECIHTGFLEMYHGLMAKKYSHTLQHYSYHGIKARTQLAILHHNQNAGRSQGQTKDGSLKHKFACRMGTGGWVAKPKYQFVDDLRTQVPKYRESANRSEITDFFFYLFDEKNPFGGLGIRNLIAVRGLGISLPPGRLPGHLTQEFSKDG